MKGLQTLALPLLGAWLVGCNQAGDIRKTLAGCKVQEAVHELREYPFLEDCMQAHGYKLDDKATSPYGACSKLASPYIEPSCYRTDT